MATIRTERLVLRPLELSDAARIAAFTRDWDVARMVSSIPFPQPQISVEGFLLDQQESVKSSRSPMVWAVNDSW